MGWDFSLERGEQKGPPLQNHKVNVDLVLIRFCTKRPLMSLVDRFKMDKRDFLRCGGENELLELAATGGCGNKQDQQVYKRYSKFVSSRSIDRRCRQQAGMYPLKVRLLLLWVPEEHCHKWLGSRALPRWHLLFQKQHWERRIIES